MTDAADDGVWRDEKELPLSELNQAMASWDTDGQNDLGGDPGEEAAFGHGPTAGPEGNRPSTTGRTGPN
jgi:hypothetical protein